MVILISWSGPIQPDYWILLFLYVYMERIHKQPFLQV